MKRTSTFIAQTGNPHHINKHYNLFLLQLKKIINIILTHIKAFFPTMLVTCTYSMSMLKPTELLCI